MALTNNNMKKVALLLFLVVAPFHLYSQIGTKIIPARSGAGDAALSYPLGKWGYKDLQNNWIISPQFAKAYNFNNDGIAEVIIGERKRETHPQISIFAITPQTQSTVTQIGLIDLKGSILVSYKSSTSQKRKDKKYEQALEIATERREQRRYDDVYVRLDRVDAAIMEQKQRRQREQARQDSILMAQRLLKMRADSIATAKRVADSLRLAKEREIIARLSSGNRLSLNKVKVTGHGMLLSKDETWREYTIRMGDFNRILITYEGNTRLRGELDVLKTIYESDWSLLSDDLFHSVEIAKATIEISQGALIKKFGAFSFLFTLNLDDLDSIYADKEANLTVLTAASQVDRFIASFMRHYQSSAHFVEPLFQVKVGCREGITVDIVDKQDNGASLEDVKRICNEAQQKFATQSK